KSIIFIQLLPLYSEFMINYRENKYNGTREGFHLEYIIFIIISYLLGSIPSALIVGNTFYKIDIREHGSGNMGATNAFRVLGTKAGIVVTAADILKGTIATLIPLLASLFGSLTVRFPEKSSNSSEGLFFLSNFQFYY